MNSSHHLSHEDFPLKYQKTQIIKIFHKFPHQPVVCNWNAIGRKYDKKWFNSVCVIWSRNNGNNHDCSNWTSLIVPVKFNGITSKRFFGPNTRIALPTAESNSGKKEKSLVERRPDSDDKH